MEKVKKYSTKEFEDAIIAFHYKIADELRTEALQLKFTPSQLEVIRYVAEKENPTMKDIARHLRITAPSVTTIINLLHKKELLKREFDPGDRRVVRIVLAPKAWKFFSVMKDKKLMILKNIFSKLDRDDKRELIRMLLVLIK
jgi:DNA-binding MarR family transcriptional regulator